MLFNSYVFAGLLIITFFLYYSRYFSKFQVPLLIISSLLFYSYNQPVLSLLLLLSVSLNVISSYYVVYGKLERKKLYATLGVAVNLLILLFFKYSPLFSVTFFEKNDAFGEFLLTMPLPIGISFFTFQGISLVIDVFKGKYHKEVLTPKSFLAHAWQILLFKTFFPQLVAGPIIKAHDFIPQIKKKLLRDIDWEAVFKAIVIGYFLKMVVADNLKDFTYYISFPDFRGQSSLTLIVLLFGYSCQIFADFAGYSSIAIGVAGLFGYYFPKNFNYPYISSSFKEFWKRWHISLSSFLMEYLYIPLGGNRKGKVRTYINLIIVMLLGGLWHGAAWSYLVWGGIHGIALALEKFITEHIRVNANSSFTFGKGVFVFVFVSFAWILFKLPNFSHVVDYFISINKNLRMVDDYKIITYVLLYSSPVLIYHLAYLLRDSSDFIPLKKYEYVLYSFALFLILFNSGSIGEFIYFQF